MFSFPERQSSRWVCESCSYELALHDGHYNSIQVVRASDVKGLRKIKNFKVCVNLCPPGYNAEHVMVWILGVQKEANPGAEPAEPLVPLAPGNIGEVLNVPESVIVAGITGNVQEGKPTFCPLARLLDSGDSVLLYLLNESGNGEDIWCSLAVSYSICYA
jgi:hypothetical protein